LAELHAAGARLEPALALRVVSLMVDPDWTKGTRFTIAYEGRRADAPGAYLHVRDKPIVGHRFRGARNGGEHDLVPGKSLRAVLDGADAEDAVVRGDEHPPALLQSWVKRAQSG
jgi:hypothetical protein